MKEILTTIDDLVKRDGLYYKKFTDVPFSGEVADQATGGVFTNGKKEGLWVEYWENGQLQKKGTYENGKKEGTWVTYF
jgi:hypothetical protein